MAEEIIDKARKGDYDRERVPRLYRRVRCERCGNLGDRYIDYMKEGRIEVEPSRSVEVEHKIGYYTYRETERVTQIYVKARCERCGHENRVTDPVLTVEYLLKVTEYKGAQSSIYI